MTSIKFGAILFNFLILALLTSAQIAYGQFRLEPSPLDMPDYPVRNQKLFIINESADEPLLWTASVNADWVTLSPTSGIITGEYGYITVRISRESLNVGQHSATISVITSKGNKTIPISVFKDGGLIPEIQIEHTVTITQPETHYAHIKTVLRNVSWMEWVRMSSHTFELEDNWLENIATYDEDGSPLENELVIVDESLRWRRLTIQNPGASDEIIMEYDIHYLNHDLNSASSYQSGIMEDRAVFDFQHIFFAPNMTHDGNFYPMHDDLRITFSGQPTWEVASPWVGFGNTYNILEIETGVLFSYGDYDNRILDLNGLEIRIAIPPGAMEYTQLSKEEILNEIERIATIFQGIYGNPSQSGLKANDIINFIITYPPLNSHDGAAGSAALDISDFNLNAASAITGAFEYWSLCEPGGKNWSNSVDYFLQTYKLLGFITETQFTDELLRKYRAYEYEIYETKYDVSIPDLVDILYYNNSNELSEEDLIGYSNAYEYKKTIFWHMVDQKMLKLTNSNNNMFDFLKYMGQNHATDGCPDESAINALTLITGFDFTTFFNDYYYGTKKLIAPFKSEGIFIPIKSKDGKTSVIYLE